MCVLRVSCCGWLEILLLPAGAAPNVTFHTSDGHPVGNGGCSRGYADQTLAGVTRARNSCRPPKRDAHTPARLCPLSPSQVGFVIDWVSFLSRPSHSNNRYKLIRLYFAMHLNGIDSNCLKVAILASICYAWRNPPEVRRKIFKDWQLDSVRSGD